MVIYLSNFIWNIEIKGTDKIDSNELMQTINNEGLTIGKLKSKVDLKSIINKIRLDRADIAWIGIDLKGTNAIVKVVEADSKPEIIEDDEYCNIISDKDACIIKVNAQNGTPLVKEGDVIKSGTPLIGGWMEGKYTGTRYVHAEGTVEAKVWYSHKERIFFKQTEKRRTGNEETKYTININNFKINLYKKLSKFENYDTIREEKKLKLFSNLYLPAGITLSNNYEVVNNDVIYSLDEAKKIVTKPEIGEIKAYMPNSSDGRIYQYKDEYIITDKLEYIGSNTNNARTLEIGNQGGNVLMSFVNNGIGIYESNDDVIIKHDGSLINKLGKTKENLNFSVSFDLVIKVSNKSYRTNINLDLPCGDIIQEGTSTYEITDTDRFIFKREN